MLTQHYNVEQTHIFPTEVYFIVHYLNALLATFNWINLHSP